MRKSVLSYLAGLALAGTLFPGIAPASNGQEPVASNPLPVLSNEGWKAVAGVGADVSKTRVQASPDKEAINLYYGFLRKRDGSTVENGYAEYLWEKGSEWAALPTQVSVEFKAIDPNMEGNGPRLVMIRFVDARGTMFQWRLAKVNSSEWASYILKVQQGTGGFVTWNEKVKDAAGKKVYSTTPTEVVGPVKLHSLIIKSQADGDDAHGILSMRYLNIRE